ncbi:MAG: hypothetical protein ACM3WV_11315 [Bacillota bacterium]
MLKIKTLRDAVEFIDQSGFLFLFRHPYGFHSMWDLVPGGTWFTGEENDPWRWKDEIAREKKAVYTKFCGNRSIFIALDWYPKFLAVYRPSGDLRDRYLDGLVSRMSMEIHQCLDENGPQNTHNLKGLLGIRSKEAGRAFERSLLELQNQMYITICGASQRINKSGEPYGWMNSEYELVDRWFGASILNRASEIPKLTAMEKIASRAKETAPGLAEQDVKRSFRLKFGA